MSKLIIMLGLLGAASGARAQIPWPAQPKTAEQIRADAAREARQTGEIIATPEPGAPDFGHVVGLSISPLYLLFPIVEGQLEIMVADRFSLALIGGGGTITLRRTVGVQSRDETFTLWEAGGQLRTYFTGNSQRGAVAGVEVLWMRAKGDEIIPGLSGTGLQAGLIVGYKWAWASGLTVDLNLGAGFLFVSGQAEGESKDEIVFVPIPNFAVGYAF